jgi:purine-nucleoside/S-methyl-5'-thioadenosine phosphorylase / adenosine deaminase
MSEVEVIRAESLGGTRHGFLGRRGGVSLGVCAGLNCGLGSDDDHDDVVENRRRAADSVAPGGALVSVHQVHSAEAVIATAPWPDDARPHADAVVTAKSGLILGVVTADCAPILLADREAGVIAAAHAGWKGAVDGVLAATVSAMVSLGARADRIAAAVGPMIARPSYEIDDRFRRHFLAANAANEGFFADRRPGHWQFDLEGFVVTQLADAGVGRVEALGLDTYADPDRFYSFRRATHRREPDYGRQLSLIAL